ncbi:MAG: hypothetical protein KDD10_10485 [Phaeodactylibacter sp.]|nr:hypothetical protein [Phaeodactylibacter sp.]MCB9296086.1 hypothetical protein [Lewinellaceae bacterium]
MTNDILIWILALLAGAALGVIFFGGLWWTVRKGLTARRPGLLFLGSMLARSAIVLTGFYLIGGDSWEKLLAALLGFIGMRAVITRLTRHSRYFAPQRSGP